MKMKFFLEKGLDKTVGMWYNDQVTRHAVLAQLDRVPGYEPVGRGFESLTPCQQKYPMLRHWVFLLARRFGTRISVQVASKIENKSYAATEGSGAQLDQLASERSGERVGGSESRTTRRDHHMKK